MRVVFMGTPDFAVGCLDAVIKAGYDTVGVFCQPDKPKGRGHKLCSPPVKERALEMGIPVFQPARIRDGEALQKLKELSPDIIIVVAYGKILPGEILNLPKYGCINVHASILPELRGAAPIQWSIINGFKTTGVTVMKMDEGMDTGDILSQRCIEIGRDTNAGELFDKLSAVGAELLVETLPGYISGEITPVKQDGSVASAAPMLSKEMSVIDWKKPAEQIHDLIRGLCPWPVAVTYCGETRIKVYSSSVVECPSAGAAEGEVVDNAGRLVVKCGSDTAIELKEVQRDGSKRMQAADMLRGFKIEKGAVLGG